MAPREVLSYLNAEPFRPFQIRVASGRSYVIRRPTTVCVTLTALVIFSSVSDDPDVYDRWETASLDDIELLSHL
jgi:hypothetical protein